MMEKFDTLLEAAELAVTRSTGWSFATSNDRYDATGLLALAEMSDSEDPLDEDGFSVVSPAGAIGISHDGEDIDWLFLSDAAPNEELPQTYEAAPQMKFCPKCGAPIIPGARFCERCGGKLC